MQAPVSPEAENVFDDDPYATAAEPPDGFQGLADTRDLATRLPDGLAAHGELAPSNSLASQRRIGNYVIERELGRGGMGTVFLAAHASWPDRRYALKLINVSLQSRESRLRFQAEVEATGKTLHRNIVTAIDAGFHNDQPYLVTEFIDGMDVGKLLRKRSLPAGVVCEMGRQVAIALETIHANGIIHRDVKPQNIMLQSSGQVKLLDLGLALMRRTDETGAAHSASPAGTPVYMPPEQWLPGEPITPAADIYALGATLYELFSGRPPFSASVQGLKQAHLNQVPPSLIAVAPDVPSEVARLIDRCLAKEPAHRPKSAGEIALALQAYSAPIGSEILPAEDVRPSVAAAAFEAFVADPPRETSRRTSRTFFAFYLTSIAIAVGSLGMAYYGPSSTPAWQLRFDQLGNPRLPRIGFMIEAARAVIFLTLVFLLAYWRYRIPVQRFLSPRFHTSRIWGARVVFGLAVAAFLLAEIQRQWLPENAATELADWANARPPLATSPALEVMPYRWNLVYSCILYVFVFGGLLILPILQFLLADLPFVRHALVLFKAAQNIEANGPAGIDRLYTFSRLLRKFAARYVDTAGVLALGVQFEFWIGEKTLTPKAYAVEITGMVVTAAIMVLVIAYLVVCHTVAHDHTEQMSNLCDHRQARHVEPFGAGWFLRTTVGSRPSGIALLSLLPLPFVP